MDFARYHPGGSLGRKLLTRVCDVMHSPAPVVSPSTSFHDCLLVMTRSRLGLTVVMDGEKLVGIVTDGDLRRALLEDESTVNASVSQFMTANPHTILEDAQLSEAELYMHDNKIRALAVTNSIGNVVGVVEIFD
ncbi:Arabinose 5-phosphate isomerase KpsF [compost metagenome]